MFEGSASKFVSERDHGGALHQSLKLFIYNFSLLDFIFVLIEKENIFHKMLRLSFQDLPLRMKSRLQGQLLYVKMLLLLWRASFITLVQSSKLGNILAGFESLIANPREKEASNGNAETRRNPPPNLPA